MVRVQEEVRLDPLDRVEDEEEEHAEDEDRLAVALPVLLAIAVRAHEPEEAVLEPGEEAPGRLRGGVHPRHPDAQRVPEGDEHQRVDDDLGDALAGHLELSPRNSA